MTPTMADLRAKRKANDIVGRIVARRAGIGNPRLCELELGNATPSNAEVERIASAIDSVIAERQQIAQLAEERGLSLAGVGF
jgi:predicted transcriptional regulator